MLSDISYLKKIIGKTVVDIQEEDSNTVNHKVVTLTFNNDYKIRTTLYEGSSMFLIEPTVTITREEYQNLIETKAKYEGLQK